MAIKPDASYPGRIVAADANYPYGSGQNETVTGAEDGTPVEVAWINDLWGLLQGLLWQEGITPSGSADTALLSQYLEVINRIAAMGDYYDTFGTVDAIVLNPRETNGKIPGTETTGVRVRFKSGGVNTIPGATLTLSDSVTTIGPYPMSLTQVANGGTPTIPAGMLGADMMVTAILDQTPDTLTTYWRIVGGPARIISGDNSSAFLPSSVSSLEEGGTVFTDLSTSLKGRGMDYTGGPGDVTPQRIRCSIFDASTPWGSFTWVNTAAPVYSNANDLVLTGIPWSATKREFSSFMRFSAASSKYCCPVSLKLKDNGSGVATVDEAYATCAVDPSTGSDHELVIYFDANGVD